MTNTALAGASAPAAGRRVTPTGRLILPADADRAAWLTARRQGLGSSDMAAVLGISRYGNALSVYHDKTGGLPLEGDDSEPALWGRAIEDTVAREWARRNRSVVRRVGLVANVDRPWQMCTLDRRVLECPLADGRERCAVEIKCRAAFKAGQWRTGCPDDVLAQTLWQADVCGYDHIHVGVLIGGNDYRQFVVRVADHGGPRSSRTTQTPTSSSTCTSSCTTAGPGSSQSTGTATPSTPSPTTSTPPPTSARRRPGRRPRWPVSSAPSARRTPPCGTGESPSPTTRQAASTSTASGSARNSPTPTRRAWRTGRRAASASRTLSGRHTSDDSR